MADDEPSWLPVVTEVDDGGEFVEVSASELATLIDAASERDAAIRRAEEAEELASRMDAAAHAALRDIGYTPHEVSNWGVAAMDTLPDEARRLHARRLHAELTSAQQRIRELEKKADEVQQRLHVRELVERIRELEGERDRIAAETREQCAAVADEYAANAATRGNMIGGAPMHEKEIRDRQLGQLVSENIAAAIRRLNTPEAK